MLVESSSVTPRSARFHPAVQDVIRGLGAQPNVTNVESPFASGNTRRVSSYGRSALVEFDIRGKSEDAQDKVEPILAAVANAERARPQFTIEEFGGGRVSKGISDHFGKDLLKAGAISLPVTLGILLLTFGAFQSREARRKRRRRNSASGRSPPPGWEHRRSRGRSARATWS